MQGCTVPNRKLRPAAFPIDLKLAVSILRIRNFTHYASLISLKTANMIQIVHKIDPKADTIIILKNPLFDANFAVWDDPNAEERDAKDSVPQDLPAQEPSVEEATFGGPMVEANGAEEEDSHNGIQYHVSSSHLKLGSAYFDNMLSRGIFPESIPNEEDGRYYITVNDWDEEAFLILLNVLHLRNRQVPRSVSLVMLTKIALLVDYFDCAEAVEPWTDIWTKELMHTTHIPSELCRDLLLWMFIAWVLRLPDEFAQTTAIAIKQSKQEELFISDLPIAGFVESIDKVRIQAIGTIISRLHDLLDEYRNANYQCPTHGHSFECGSILYGALTKGLDSLELLSPYPEAPFSGVSIKEICSKACRMKSPTWGSPHSTYYSNEFSIHACNLKKRVAEITNGVQKPIEGLQLTDFRRTQSG